MIAGALLPVEVEEVALSAYLAHVDACTNGCRPQSHRRIVGTLEGTGTPCRIGARLAGLLERAQHEASRARVRKTSAAGLIAGGAGERPPPGAPVHLLMWRGPVRLARLAVAACIGLEIAGEWLSDDPDRLTCKACRAVAVVRELLDGSTVLATAAARILAGELEAELESPVGWIDCRDPDCFYRGLRNVRHAHPVPEARR